MTLRPPRSTLFPTRRSSDLITPFLWFDDQAEEAVKFYTSIFQNSKVETITRYGEAGPGPKGSVMTIAFEDRKSTRLNSSHTVISYAVFCLKKKKRQHKKH